MKSSSSFSSFLYDLSLSKNDWEEVVQMDQSIFPQPWTNTHWINLATSSNYYLSLLKIDDQIAAVSLFSINHLESLAHLMKALVAPKFRSRGLASKLLSMSFAELKEKTDLNKVFLEVSCGNEPAIKLYKRLGFEELNRVKSFYGNGDDAYTMLHEFIRS